MKRLLWTPLLLLAACGPSEPALAPEAVSLLSLEPPPVYALLGYRDRLNLTSAQVVALDSIAQQVREANRAPQDSLRDERNAPDLQQARTLVDQVRQNNRRAAEAVHALLSDEQRTQTCDLFGRSAAAADSARRERRQPRPQGQGRSRANAADSLFAPRRGPVWYWCTTASSATPKPANG